MLIDFIIAFSAALGVRLCFQPNVAPLALALAICSFVRRETISRSYSAQDAVSINHFCPQPRANTEAMQLHLNEISKYVAPKAHAVVPMDRAGWHRTGRLKVPKNLTIILLPSKWPKLNPVENVRQYLWAN